MKNSLIYYSVGALLYCPANNETIADSVISGKFEQPYSLALCLEDTINDCFVKEAEEILLDSLQRIHRAVSVQDFYLPKIFIRVRSSHQALSLARRLGEDLNILTGFIAPKFSLENADGYLAVLTEINRIAGKPCYLMPIFEDPSMINLQNRFAILYQLKEKLDLAGPLILNIRVGGNDLCHQFGFRRHCQESIYGIRPVAHILTDILTVFAMDYVVSGPVWEYYSGPGWDTGLKKEVAEDLLCGFIGKTVIHPNQISIVNDALKISAADLADAKAITGWDTASFRFVSGSAAKERMNEYKTHSNWAMRTLFLGEYYGVQAHETGQNLFQEDCRTGNSGSEDPKLPPSFPA